MTENILWGWEQFNDDICHGTFESREDALADALEHLNPGERRAITIGHIKELEAADYVTVDSDQLLEQATQEICDAFGYDEDRLFDFVSTEIIPEAVQELHVFMRGWATKYLHNVDGFFILENTDAVELSSERSADEDGDGDGGDGDDEDDYDDSEDDEDSDEEDEGDEEEKTDEGKEKE